MLLFYHTLLEIATYFYIFSHKASCFSARPMLYYFMKGGVILKRLGNNDLFNLEIFIGDFAESVDIKTATELETFSDAVHRHIEYALGDFADDHSITDYDPQY